MLQDPTVDPVLGQNSRTLPKSFDKDSGPYGLLTPVLAWTLHCKNWLTLQRRTKLQGGSTTLIIYMGKCRMSALGTTSNKTSLGHLTCPSLLASYFIMGQQRESQTPLDQLPVGSKRRLEIKTYNEKRVLLQSTDKQFHQDSEPMYQSIVSQPVKFAVMNDYTRTVTADILSTYVTFSARQKYPQPRRYITDYI